MYRYIYWLGPRPRDPIPSSYLLHAGGHDVLPHSEFHLLGGGGELKDFGGGGSSLGPLGVKNKVSKNLGGN